jgi:hypothetical protein
MLCSLFQSKPTFWRNIFTDLHGLLSYPKDGGNMFLWTVCWLSTDYKALYNRRSNSLWLHCENLKLYILLSYFVLDKNE